MSYEYSENVLVQESAGELLEKELGWEVAYAYNTEVLGADGTFGRRSYREVLLVRYFRRALKTLNPWITDAQIDEAQQKLESRLASASDMQINEEKYFLIRDGIKVMVKAPGGKTESRFARVVDFEHPEDMERNHFLAIKELKIHGELYRRRTDIVGFVNGIPLLFMEFKKNTVDVQNAYTDNYRDYRDTIPQLFYYNAFLILSNGENARVGTLGSKYEFFHEWKRLTEADEGCADLRTMLRGICNKTNFLDLLENFILYDHADGGINKILAQNHQFLGVNNAVEAYRDREARQGKLGVFWHTQGSGKSYSMLFLAKKIRRKFAGSPTFVILTDRDELNTQISGTFERCGLLGKVDASKFIAADGGDLVDKLKANPSFIFTLIQKFNQPHQPPIIPDHDIIIFSDEAHRSQYGIFAENMCRLLPTASRIGFTGTPLLADDHITERTFGGYVSVYDFKRAVEDGATVPLYYENRGEKLRDLENPEINDRILEAIEQADLDPAQEEKLKRAFAKEIQILSADKRLDIIAKDFVEHYSDLWTCGKAMFVCLNKVNCVRMYNFAQKYWQAKIAELEKKLKITTDPEEAQELERKIAWMKETEMAVVISPEQNEIQTFKAWGLDIIPHRTKMEKRRLDKEYQSATNPLRIVFVCAMWLTGFDVKTLACLYLDKPLKAHTLMQTIARANRVAEGKTNGLIIDYIGIVKALRKALADYTSAKPGGNVPTADKEKLLARIREIIARSKATLQENGFDLAKLVAATGFDKIALQREAADLMCATLELKKQFQTCTNELRRMVKYVNPGQLDDATIREKNAIVAIADRIQVAIRHADTTALMVQINEIVSEYISVEEHDPKAKTKPIDISKIDFELLRQEFAKRKNKHLILRDLQALIEASIERALRKNSTRIDYYERYQAIIEEYNSEKNRVKIEKTFMDLMKLASDLDAEQKRYIREDFKSDEELAIYDLLFKESLTPQDIKKLKTVAAELLAKVKQKIAEFDHWRDKDETRSAVELVIRDILWEELPESFDENSINDCRERIYEYVYSRYPAVAV